MKQLIELINKLESCPHAYYVMSNSEGQIVGKNGQIVCPENIYQVENVQPNTAYRASEYTCSGGRNGTSCFVGKPDQSCSSRSETKCGKIHLEPINMESMLVGVTVERFKEVMEGHSIRPEPKITLRTVKRPVGPSITYVRAGNVTIATVEWSWRGSWEYSCKLGIFKKTELELETVEEATSIAEQRMGAYLHHLHNQ